MNDDIMINRDGRWVVKTRLRVRYHETDAMGIVHHASYICWFEEGRSALTRAAGYPYARMEQEGVLLAVAEVTARYHRPARYDEIVVITTTLAHVGSRGMTFTYEVTRAEDGELLVSGQTMHITIDRAGSVIRLPEAVRAHYSHPPALRSAG